MRLKCLKAGGYSRNVAPQPISVAEGAEFEVEDGLGAELLKTFPGWFEKLGKPQVAESQGAEPDGESPRRSGKGR